MSWARVSKANPCPICGKPDWCTLGESGACCMRVASERAMANGGYFHPYPKTVERRPVREAPKPAPTINASVILKEWANWTTPQELAHLAQALGVSRDSVASLGAVRSSYRDTWAFPMCDGQGRPVGIRLRSMDGQKWAVKGSREGVFLPCGMAEGDTLICEGPTDTAAALTLGYYAIGRPSCSGGMDATLKLIRSRRVRRAVIVSDLDGPGLRGAEMLRRHLLIPSCILTLPTKDLRQFVRVGGTRADLAHLIRGVVWHQP